MQGLEGHERLDGQPIDRVPTEGDEVRRDPPAVGIDAHEHLEPRRRARVDPFGVTFVETGLHDREVQQDARRVLGELLVVADLDGEPPDAGSEEELHGQRLAAGLETEDAEPAVGGEASAHLAEVRRLPGHGGDGDVRVALVAGRFEGDELVDGRRVGRPVDEPRFGAERVGQPPPAPRQLLAVTPALLPLVVAVVPPVDDAALHDS